MTAVLGLALLGQVMFAAVDVEDVAQEAGVDVVDLLAASNATGLEPRAYLVMTGELRPAGPSLNTAVERRLDCIQWYESSDTPTATNARSRAAGLFQFLPSTWATTPQGKSGLSPYDPVAARAAARWMINAGRIREWDVVRMGLC